MQEVLMLFVAVKYQNNNNRIIQTEGECTS